MVLTKFSEIEALVKGHAEPRRMAVAVAADAHTLEAALAARKEGLVSPVLVGDKAKILNILEKMGESVPDADIYDEPDEVAACEKAVALVREGAASFLMKGKVDTKVILKAVVNKEHGLGVPGAIMSHVTLFEVPAYHKLLVCSDVAIIPDPDFKQKQAMLNYIISTAKSLEIAKPKVAVIAATEQVSVGMRACSEGAWLGMMSQRGQLKGAIVDGPLSLDCSIDKESAMTKKLTSEVAGDADGLLFPNIESGNVFYKACTKFAGAELACMVVGAKVPCVLTSRGDSIQSKLYSIALAALNTK